MLNAAKRVTAAHGAWIDKSNQDEIAISFNLKLGEERQILMQFAFDSSPFQTTVTASAADALAQDIAHCEAVERQRLAAEIRLLAKTSERSVNAPAGDISLVFQGSVGSVQTGAGSTANVNQTIDSQARELLSAALEKLLSDLNSHQGDLPFNKTEVKELVIEAQAETAKSAPNITKLRSVVKGIGTAIEYVPKTKEAYDALKWAGALIGLVLP